MLNRCLASVMDWMRANKLKLNPDKTEAMLVGGFLDWVAGRLSALDGVTLQLKEQVHSSGILLDLLHRLQ